MISPSHTYKHTHIHAFITYVMLDAECFSKNRVSAHTDMESYINTMNQKEVKAEVVKEERRRGGGG